MVKSKFLRDSYTRGQASVKLQAKQLGPFEIVALVGPNAVRSKFPPSFTAHLVINVCYTKKYYEQPKELSDRNQLHHYLFNSLKDQKNMWRRSSISRCKLHHRRRSRGTQLLVQWKGQTSHESTWEPSRNLADADGKINEQL